MKEREKLQQTQALIQAYRKLFLRLCRGEELTEEEQQRFSLTPVDYVQAAYRHGREQMQEQPKNNEEWLELLYPVSEQQQRQMWEKMNTRLIRYLVSQLKAKKMVVSTVFGSSEDSLSSMASALRQLTQDTLQDWDMVLRTELVNNRLEGMASAILDGSSVYGKDGEETLVFKRPMPDACPHCKRLYLEADGITPKLFTLGQLMANGDNYGKKAKDFLPTLGPVHPHCQCELQVMPKGCGFDEQGQIVYLGGRP